MKIGFRTVGVGSGVYTTLMDALNGDTLDPWKPSYKAKVRTEDLAGNVASVFIQSLGNIVVSISLREVNVNYADAGSALAASRTVPTSLLSSINNLKVTEGSEAQYFPNAVCSSCEALVQGSNVTYTMDFTTAMVTAIEQP